MIALGIDPGETLTGYGVVERSGSRLTLLDAGCIRVPSAGKTAAEKLVIIERELLAVIQKYRPDVAVVEQLFFVKNAKTAIRVAQARGVILAACARSGVSVAEFTPLQIKQAVTGYGKAEKGQVQKMVAAILGLARPIRQDDAADAVAAALCGSAVSRASER